MGWGCKGFIVRVVYLLKHILCITAFSTANQQNYEQIIISPIKISDMLLEIKLTRTKYDVQSMKIKVFDILYQTNQP